MTNTVGPMIRKARTGAGLTQEQLAKEVTGLSASDISRAERGELIPTQEQLKAIAKVTGVTQKSLLDAAKESKTDNSSSGTSGSTGGSKKPAGSTSTGGSKKPADSTSTENGKKPAGSTSAGGSKKPAGSTSTENGKKPAGSTSTGTGKKPSDSTSTGANSSKIMEVTATERKLVELYRKASTDEKKTVMSILKGEKDTTNEMISALLDGSKKPADIVSSILGSAVESFAKKK